MEWASSAPGDDPLVYGFRKSLFYDTAKECEGYKQTMQVMGNDGVDVAKMKLVASSFASWSEEGEEQ